MPMLEKAPHVNFVLKFVLHLFVFTLALASNLFADDFDSTWYTSVVLDTEDLLDDAEAAEPDLTADDVLAADFLALVVWFDNRGCLFPADRRDL